MIDPTPTPDAPAPDLREKAIQICHRVLTFDLRKMIGKDSPDYNQAVRDAYDAVAAALRAERDEAQPVAGLTAERLAEALSKTRLNPADNLEIAQDAIAYLHAHPPATSPGADPNALTPAERERALAAFRRQRERDAATSPGAAGDAAAELQKLAHDYADRCGWPMKEGGFRRCHPDEIAKCMMAFAADVLSIVPKPAPAAEQGARERALLADELTSATAQCVSGRSGDIWDRLRSAAYKAQAALRSDRP